MRTADTQSLYNSGGNIRIFFELTGDVSRVYDVLKQSPLTMKEVDLRTGIMRESVCRHVNNLLKAGLIARTRVRRCSVTSYSNVNEYTGDSSLFPETRQLSLF